MLLYAPLTEEPAKLWPLLLPAFRRSIARGNAVRAAMALGLGFALGEMGFVASLVARQPEMLRLPFYQFSGFFFERLATCILHGGFTATALCRLPALGRNGNAGFAMGLAAAFALHLLGNAPIVIVAALGLAPAASQMILGNWVIVYAMAMGGLLGFYARSLGRAAPGLGSQTVPAKR
jgi:hypothetical protein